MNIYKTEIENREIKLISRFDYQNSMDELLIYCDGRRCVVNDVICDRERIIFFLEQGIVFPVSNFCFLTREDMYIKVKNEVWTLIFNEVYSRWTIDKSKFDYITTQNEMNRLVINSVYGAFGDEGCTKMNNYEEYAMPQSYYEKLAMSSVSHFLTTTAKSKATDMVKKVIFNPPATIVFWPDGTKTVVKCQEGDTFDEETGFLMAYFKHQMGNKGNANSILHYICQNAEGHVENRSDFNIEPITIEFTGKDLENAFRHIGIGQVNIKEPDNVD